MAKIIDFKAVKTKAKTKHHTQHSNATHQIVNLFYPCDSPIKVRRTSFSTISIGFHLECFDIPMVHSNIRRIAHLQPYRVSVISRDHQLFDPKYKTYSIRIFNQMSESDVRIVFQQIIIQITEEAYLGEISILRNHLKLNDLTKPYSATRETGATISQQTVAILKNAGIYNGTDLAFKTREEICQIPGITTMEVYRLEKSLISRGLSLLTAEPPEWTENLGSTKIAALS